MKTVRTFTTVAAAASACAILLTACGGGGGGSGSSASADSHAAGSEVPLAATQSADAAYQFVAEVGSANRDSGDPLVVGDATLATTDTEEAKPL